MYKIMTMSVLFKSAMFSIVSIYFGALAASYYYRHRKKEEIHDVIMFPTYFQQEIKNGVVKSENVERLLQYLNRAQFSLDICLYSISNSTLRNAIMMLDFKQVKLRLIVDRGQMLSTEVFAKLKNQGISIRWNKLEKKGSKLMHHKFCLIDASGGKEDIIPLALTGSLNWSSQGLYSNYEDIVVTSEPCVVKMYKAEFDSLWNQFNG